MPELGDIRTAHMIGIGGVSMSALAHALHDRGITVRGSDIRTSDRIEKLRDLGITVSIGHDAKNVGDADVVIYTTAIPEDNPELRAARTAQIPTWHRSQLLAAFAHNKRALAVTGTHGKTTTTAMLGYILTRAGMDPTIFIGGISRDFESNYRLGNSDIVVFEADESDASFHHYDSTWQIVTNIEADHLDQHNDFATVQQVFSDFIALGDPDGYLVYGADSPPLAAMAENAPGTPISFGLQSPADLEAQNVSVEGCRTDYDLIARGERVGRYSVQIPGSHYVEDALAAIGMAGCLGVAPHAAAGFLQHYQGTNRRFELRYRDDDIVVYDDYAHHPTEVRVVLAAARKAFKDSHITAVFQPHLYSRTQFLMDEFARAFADADAVVINSIYGAREQPMPGVSASDLAERIRSYEPKKPVLHIEHHDELVQHLFDSVDDTDVILTVGAGDITEVGQQLARRLKQRR
ncbi:MAG: UDP-N-acetylmuramate--L-alanine ligase [Armatimonadota bacterium]